MKSNKLRLLSLLLSLIMLLSLAALMIGCNEETPNNNENAITGGEHFKAYAKIKDAKK